MAAYLYTRVLFMHRVLRFLVLVSASLLFTGCSTTAQRLDNLEGQMHNVQVLDLRLSNAEDRLSRVEGELGGMRAAAPSSPEAGKKGSGKAKAGRHAPQPLAAGKTPAPELRAAPLSPQPAPRLESGPAAGSNASPPLPYVSIHTDGRKVEPRGLPVAAVSPPVSPQAPASAASGTPPAPALVPVGLEGAPPAAPRPVSPRPVAPKPVPPKAASVANHAPAAAPEKTGTKEYDAALALYYQGRYDKAQELFSGFLSRHPSSKLAPNAMYWQGECMYSQNKFDSAIITFKDLAGKYPKHPKAAAALLKAGFAYARMKDMENARFYWQILVDDFPKSEPAAIARKRLAQG